MNTKINFIKIRNILKTNLAILLCVNIFGFLQTISKIWHKELNTGFRANSTFPDCNSLAPYLILMICLNNILLFNKNIKIKIFGIIGYATTVLLLLLSGSRTSIGFLLLGFGLGSFFRKVASYPSLAADNKKRYHDKQYDNVHNYYFQLIAEIGILGTIIFISILILKKYYYIVVKKKKEYGFLLFGIITYLLALLLGHHLLILEHQLIFWFFLIVMIKIINCENELNCMQIPVEF